MGCGGALLLAAVLSGIVMLNWERVSSGYRSLSGTLSELRAVQTAVQAKYRTPVTVKHLRRSRAPGPTLVIQLVNPGFLRTIPEAELAIKAREVAIVARDAYAAHGSVHAYEIGFVSRAGGGITLSRTTNFRFLASELATPAAGSE